ncbi:MAG: rRNA pseudouridine synthase [Desulfobacterales bacterium]|nr:rRNA pseudouridine synthase [Desulfobacterales bacterium]
MAERIQVVLARAGIASRRKSGTIVREGRVRVNGEVVREPGFPVTFGKDDIRVDGCAVAGPEPKFTVILNKPRGMVTTLRDPQGRPTVMDIVAGIRERLFPVGRLDYDTEGLLLLTNDGLLAQRLQHPRHGVEKTYEAKVRGGPNASAIKQLRFGVVIDGRKTAPARVKMIGKTEKHTWIEIRICEGRNRQVRKMCAVVGHRVLKLKRTGYGPLRLGRLKPGSFRALTAREISVLKQAAQKNLDIALPEP